MKKTKKEKKRLFFISLILILLVVSMVKSVAHDWTQILDNNNKLQELTKEYNLLLEDEEKKVSELTKLHDDDYLARYAKEKYMYSADGETIIRIN